MECHQSFSNDRTADKHRVGKFTPNERRCLTVQEMLDKGWRQTLRGWTHNPPATKAQLAAKGQITIIKDN